MFRIVFDFFDAPKYHQDFNTADEARLFLDALESASGVQALALRFVPDDGEPVIDLTPLFTDGL